MSFDYLHDSLIEDGAPSWEVASWVDATAEVLTKSGVEPALVEMTSELLARTAAALGPDLVDAASLRSGMAYLAPPPPLLALLEAALVRPRGAAELAAVAVHLVDVAERMALVLFLPELPALTARADRSGGAARLVGVARHLKG